MLLQVEQLLLHGASAGRRAGQRSQTILEVPVFRQRQQFIRRSRPGTHQTAVRQVLDPHRARRRLVLITAYRRRGRQQEQAVVDPRQRGNPGRRDALQRGERVLSARIGGVENLVGDRPPGTGRSELHETAGVRCDFERSSGKRRPRSPFVAAECERPHIDPAFQQGRRVRPVGQPDEDFGFRPRFEIRASRQRPPRFLRPQPVAGTGVAIGGSHGAQGSSLRPEAALDRQARRLQRPRRRAKQPQETALRCQDCQTDRHIIRPSGAAPSPRDSLVLPRPAYRPDRQSGDPCEHRETRPHQRGKRVRPAPQQDVSKRRAGDHPCCAQDHRATSRRRFESGISGRKADCFSMGNAARQLASGMSEITIKPSSFPMSASAACKSWVSVPAARVAFAMFVRQAAICPRVPAGWGLQSLKSAIHRAAMPCD